MITLVKSDIARVGGAEKYARVLIRAFQEKGREVKLITSGPVPLDLHCEVLTKELHSKTSVLKLHEFNNFCKNELTNSPAGPIFALDRYVAATHIRAGSGVHKAYLSHRKETDSIFRRTSHLFNPLHRAHLKIEKNGFEHPDLQVLFTNSHLVKNEILTHYNVDEKKISVIHNGAPWQELQPHFSDWHSHHNPNHYHFLFIGHNFERKGLRPLLHSLSLLKRQDWILSVVGSDKEQKKFHRLVNQLGIATHIHFYGSQKNTIPFLQAADCLVIPSYYDPFAGVTVEALAMGLFVVSSVTNGGSEVLTKETGSIIEELNNPEAVKHSLETAMTRPKNQTLSQKIRDSVKHLALSTQLSKYIEELL